MKKNLFMKKSFSVKFVIASLCLLVYTSSIWGQNLIREVSLSKQVQNSSLIVEGKVVSKKAFLGADNNIYTLNTIEVYKVFKGESISQVNVITKGGVVGDKIQMVTHTLKLNTGDLGVFNLYNSNVSYLKTPSDKNFKVYSGAQGFYKYNIYDDVVINTFTGKKGITDLFYKDLTGFTKRDFTEIKAFSVVGETSKLRQTKRALVPTEISFFPTSVSGGTRETITITIPGGASGNFGSQQGKVSFRNADSGGIDNGLPDYIDALDTQVTNWSTNSITVEVPSDAGTGSIRVTDASQNIIDSSNDLEITYSELNVNITVSSGETYAYPTRLVDNDGSGGYIWQMETSFDAESQHPGSKADYIAALDTWRCETGLNFTIGPPTSIDESVKDGVNVIRFDNGNELEEGVLGQTTYSFIGCGINLENYEVYANEMDMVFDDGESWHFGSGLPGFEIDFQSVALHELGHTHQLGHVIDDNDDVMHYSIGFGEQLRVLSADNKEAGSNVQLRSESTVPICFSGKSPMNEFDCQLSIADQELENVISIYPNPASGVFYIKNKSSIGLQKAVIYDVSGRQILELDISGGSNLKTINLSGISKGVYFINLHSDTGIISSKLLVD